MTLPKVHEEFIGALNRAQTEYLVVGGIAVVAYGVDRNTGDLDIWMNDTAENLQSLHAALLSLNFDKTDVEAAVNAFRDSGKIAIVLDQRFPVEMMASFSSTISFSDAFAKKATLYFSGTPFHVVDLDTLIELKIKAGRDKDLWDASQLKAIKDKPTE